MVIGKAKDAITIASSRGLLSVNFKANQLLVIIWIFIARNDPNEPTHNHRKSLYLKVVRIGDSDLE